MAFQDPQFMDAMITFQRDARTIGSTAKKNETQCLAHNTHIQHMHTYTLQVKTSL